jgi:PTS system nitrogen regulatory IIA component
MARNELFRRELLSCICQEEAREKVCTAFTGVLSRFGEQGQARAM